MEYAYVDGGVLACLFDGFVPFLLSSDTPIVYSVRLNSVHDFASQDRLILTLRKPSTQAPDFSAATLPHPLTSTCQLLS